MNSNRIISRYALIATLIVVFLWTWIPFGNAAVTAERVLSKVYFLNGQANIMIELQFSGEEKTVLIDEQIPTGWIIKRIRDNGVLNGDTISWEITSLSGSSYVRYYLDAPVDAGNDAQFSGTVNGEPIGGENVLPLRRSIPAPGKQVPMYGSLYNYWLYLPSGYSDQAGQWPLILFLHGGCIVGTDLDLVLTHYDVSVLTILENPDDAEIVPELFQSIVVSPQSTVLEWDIKHLNEFLTELMSTYAIDPNRLYLYGHANGADACWAMANEYPNLLAAFFSGGMLTTAPTVSENMAGLPVWVFETEVFRTIPIATIESCMDEIKALGGECGYTLIPATTPLGLTDVYYNREIYQWLLKQNKQSRLSATSNWEMY